MVYLKQVTAYGFKSFADKTTVNFDNGVTAIVGPNGSGKSNITDAIKWVLGEQSAKSLRGAKMEDVIFSGAKDRKPQNYAEVTLTMDNKNRSLNIDADIVEVTRKLYRNGDSEYLLNKQKSRLKDVTELFLDSGLGKDAFSMISQGKVDQVLNAKPEERRQLIEEAAGVLKYKKRKKETETKLEDTNNNLTRIHDIIFDLKDRVEPLQIEASIAEEYLALSEEMKDADIQVTVADIETTKKDYDQCATEINDFNGLIQFKQEKSTRLNDKINREKETYKTLQTEMNEQNQTLLNTTEQIERYIGQINVLQERLRNQHVSSQERATRLNKFEVQRVKEATRISEIKSTIQQLKKQKKQHETQLEEKLNELAHIDQDMSQRIDETRDAYYEKLSEKTSFSNEIKLIEKEIEQFNQKQSRQSGDNEKIRQEYSVLTEKIATVHASITEKEKELTSTRLAYKSALIEIEKIKSSYNDTREKYAQAKRYIEDLERKKERLTLMNEEFHGYYQGVRMLLKNKNILNGIHSTVLDVISIDARYNDALDSALGASLQHIIVEDEHSARQAIQFLRDKKYGRATFLPLTVIKGRQINKEMLHTLHAQPGYINTLSALIQNETKYQTIIDNVAGTVIVCDTLVNANSIAKVIGYKYRIVTLNGDIVNPGGSMSGGSKNKPTQALSARNELQQVNAQVDEFKATTLQLKSQIDTLSERIITEEMAADQLRVVGEELRDELHQLKLDSDALSAQERRLKVMFEEVDALMQESIYIEERRQLIGEHLDAIKEIEATLVQLNQRIAHYNEYAHDRKQLEKALTEDVSGLKHQLAVLNTNINHQNEVLKERTEQLNIILSEIKLIETDGADLNIDEVKAEISTKENLLVTLQTDKQRIDQSIQASNQAMAEMSDQIDAMEQDYNELLRQMSGIENGIGELKAKHSRLNVLLDNLMQHLSEHYQMTFDGAKEYIFESLGINDVFEQDLEQLRKRVRLTKISIEELGNVNLNAIEQYKIVNERYQFLSAQEADLLEAKSNLEAIIKDMDETVASKFMTTFQKVSHAFERIFKQLFGGGTGLLQLTSDNILSAGIDIFVEPPGKRRQNLSLLSGGERALTAIVLLFSILQARSAPFVILDEVEAALDEANVNRFADFLNTLSNDTQFIVITHRKGTMEKSDRLYGVTMQNSGITQLVSVNLKELNDQKIKELTK
ncbi:chromosome segregation protein SMC [Macrococcoides caseolyticum]|uniref:chromosome segregation protein SMC n=1 Tax=Macrococcoides caseolyticum TaxID=69966 RepID=UPI001F451722|nr:chromosome segregation protein SMC [Macrococcus caseolyticus]MCE4956776.1 chromosome segregation protein SMC [Macrococcus caseolyticus]